jgi:hypothetical protein
MIEAPLEQTFWANNVKPLFLREPFHGPAAIMIITAHGLTRHAASAKVAHERVNLSQVLVHASVRHKRILTIQTVFEAHAVKLASTVAYTHFFFCCPAVLAADAQPGHLHVTTEPTLN